MKTIDIPIHFSPFGPLSKAPPARALHRKITEDDVEIGSNVLWLAVQGMMSEKLQTFMVEISLPGEDVNTIQNYTVRCKCVYIHPKDKSLCLFGIFFEAYSVTCGSHFYVWWSFTLFRWIQYILRASQREIRPANSYMWRCVKSLVPDIVAKSDLLPWHLL